MTQIIQFPNYKEINNKIKELKKSIENLILEKDNLQYVICENIKNEYMINFGSLEYKIYKAYIQYLRLNRKKELIQAKKNRQETILLRKIESQLEQEFIKYKIKLDEKISELNRAIRHSKADLLSNEEQLLLKNLYRNIVKVLHPDLNPLITDAQKELFRNATESYKEGNLNYIQIIYDIVCNEKDKDNISLTSESLEEELERLKSLEKQIEKDIELIKNTQPYTWAIYINDEINKHEKLYELEQKLRSFEEAIKTQEEYIDNLMKDY